MCDAFSHPETEVSSSCVPGVELRCRFAPVLKLVRIQPYLEYLACNKLFYGLAMC